MAPLAGEDFIFSEEKSKRLLCRYRGSLRQRTLRKQKFFGSFFAKKNCFPAPPLKRDH
jgi:hypothetical protein